MIYCYLCIILTSTYFGFILASGYKIKYETYKELYDFLNYYKMEIGFSQKKFSQIIDSFNELTKKDYLKLDELKNYIDLSIYNQKDFRYKSFLFKFNENESKEVECILNKLGKYDLNQEKQNIEILLSEVSEKKELANKNKKKYCNLYIKLGIIFGCFVVVIII